MMKMGILSDKMYKENCTAYHAFPLGFANADYEGGLSNPYLTGIKIPKYQRSAPKPASADVMAVSHARFMHGNQQQNARAMLEQYQKEAKVWKPPPVKLHSAVDMFDRVYAELDKEGRGSDVFEYKTQEEVITERNNRFYNTTQPKVSIPSRGTQILVQTISTQAEIPSIDEILFRYSSLANSDIQKGKLVRVYRELRREGVQMPDFILYKARHGTVSERKKQLRYLVERAYAQGSNIGIYGSISTLRRSGNVRGRSVRCGRCSWFYRSILRYNATGYSRTSNIFNSSRTRKEMKLF